MASNKEVYEKVTNKLIAAIEGGNIPWVKPWKDGGGFGGRMPLNAVTGRHYNGANVLVLWFSGYSCPGWLTFNQTRAAKASVAKGEKGTPVYYMSVLEVKDADNPGEKKKIFMAKGFTVFNVEQLADSPAKDKLLAKFAPKKVAPKPTHERKADLDAIVSATRASISYGGDRAFYSPASDRIGMPELAQFQTVDSFYSILFHELGHWTGHATRLDRIKSTMFGSNDYAAEELVAELTAAFLSHRNGLDFETQSAGYLQSWLKGFKNDTSLLIRAASAAQKAADLIQPGAIAAPELAEAA